MMEPTISAAAMREVENCRRKIAHAKAVTEIEMALLDLLISYGKRHGFDAMRAGLDRVFIDMRDASSKAHAIFSGGTPDQQEGV